jgi:outer membrane lipoprotein-sorting protein
MTFLPGPAGDVKEFLKKTEAKKEGQETVEKTLCDIYTYTEKETKWNCKLWVEQKTLNPVKMVMTGTKKTDVINVAYVSYRTRGVIADSRFDLPKGMEVRPMPQPKEDAPKKEGDAAPAEPAEKK